MCLYVCKNVLVFLNANVLENAEACDCMQRIRFLKHCESCKEDQTESIEDFSSEDELQYERQHLSAEGQKTRSLRTKSMFCSPLVTLFFPPACHPRVMGG